MNTPARRWPLVPTLVVLAAASTMVALGIWQLQRAQWKEGLIATYQAALARSEPVPFPRSEAAAQAALYRRSTVLCAQVVGVEGIAGRSADGVQGWAQIATCRLDGGGQGEVALGWSAGPALVDWPGGTATGLIVPAADGVRLLADPPQAGLAPLARPDPADLPNNHLAYAGQWFFFAATALLIYWLALRRRWR